MKTTLHKLLWTLAILALVATGIFWYQRRSSSDTIVYRTEPVSRGDLLVSISATGTIEPEDVIDVGAQVAGQILSFGKDADGQVIDYGSNVKKGMVLARIDDSLYAAQAAQAKAQLDSAKATAQRAKADIGQAQAKLNQAEADWKRAVTIGPSKALSQTVYDGYKATYETAKAAVAVAEATIVQTEADVVQAEAALKGVRRNLDYCTIKSPVDGVIIDRRVNIGQTVVASLNAPSLFLLAADLKQMQVWVAVNEADIGQIHEGIPVTFTVDAFPNDQFKGKVRKVRLNASMTQNVVTYTVEITTDNANGRLLPYLTANVRFELQRQHDVFMVPNSALRWTPTTDQIDPAFRDLLGQRQGRKGDKKEVKSDKASKAKTPGAPPPPAASRNDRTGRGILWTLQDQKVRPVKVSTGQSDGVMTEVEGEGVSEGLAIITGVETQSAGSGGAETNPFTPKLPSRRGGPR
jgi:HlyD family secretion protein